MRKKAVQVLVGCLAVILLLLLLFGLLYLVISSRCSNGGEEEEVDITAPVISDVTISDITYTKASISWTTNEAAYGQVVYGTTTSYGLFANIGASPISGTTDENVLTGLSPGTTYHFQVTSVDKSKNVAKSDDYTFTTIDDVVVDFPDVNLETAIRGALAQISGAIYASKLENITSIDAGKNNIADLNGIEYCNNIEILYLDDNLLIDISPLSGLTKLRNLDLSHNYIIDIGPLYDNPGLGTGDKINLYDNRLSTNSQNLYIPALKTRGVSVYS